MVLESDDAETVLYLREGTGVRSGEPIESNEGELDHNYRRASIQRSLNAGTYTVEATTYNAGETGSFTLSMSVAGETGGPPPVAGDCGIAEIEADGVAVPGSWSNDCQSEVTADRNARYYTFTLEAAADVTITLDSDDGDDEPVLHLREGESKTGTEVDKNEGIGPDYTRAEIMVDSLDAGTYTIEARTYRADYEGAFTLTVSVAGAAPPPVSGDCDIAPIATDGSPQKGAWANDCQSEVTADRNARYYTFTLDAAAGVTITLDSDDGDDEPVLHLREGASKTGTEVDKNEGIGPDYTRAEIMVDSLDAGTYTIEARTYRADYEGAFTLTVSVAGAAPPPVSGDCDIAPIATDGSPQKGAWANDCQSEVTADRNARYYTFTLDAAAGVTITLDSDDGDDEPVLHLREGASKTGTEVDKNEGIGPDYTRAEIMVDSLDAGTYTIEARTYHADYEGAFTLTVSVAGAAPPSTGLITFVEPNWFSGLLQTYIARYMLEHGYGYTTKSVDGPISDQPGFLRGGEAHFLMEAWLDGSTWEQFLQDGSLVSLGPSLGSDWQSAFVIPAYLQEQYPGLDHVNDLKEQRYKSIFATAETGGKARLVSCVQGWSCEEDNQRQIEEYGLNDHVHIAYPSSQDDLFASITGAYENQEPCWAIRGAPAARPCCWT